MIIPWILKRNDDIAITATECEEFDMTGIGVYSYVIFGNKFDMPYKEMICSVSPLADEIVIITDPRFKDGTLEDLMVLSENITSLKVIPVELDLNNPGIDGAAKEIARSYCKSRILLQMDADEIVHERDIAKIISLVDKFNLQNMIITGTDQNDNPVTDIIPVEYRLIRTGVVNWFNGNNFKMSSAGWIKERMSLNDSEIIHGIPVRNRIPVGQYYRAEEGKTDGAGYINTSGIPIPYDATFANLHDFPKDYNNPDSIWIHHYSWYSLPRKWEMKHLLHYFWGLLYGKYSCIDDYKYNLDDELVIDFWNPPDSKPLEEYILPIKDEMKNKSIRHAPSYIKHPDIMQDWLSRQRIIDDKGIRSLLRRIL